MQSFRWYLRRLQSMGAAEIAWRVQSMLRDQADIIRIPLGLLPRLPPDVRMTPESLSPGFSCSPVTRDDWCSIDAETRQAWLDRLTDQADRIPDNNLSYFDLENVHHGDPFDCTAITQLASSPLYACRC